MSLTIRTVAGIAAAALAMSLSACGVANNDAEASASSTPLATGPVTLSVNWWGGDERQARTQQVIELFEKEHPNITVEPQFADWSGYWDKLATATAGNNAPDVMQMDEMYLSSYASRGALADLGPLNITTDGIPESVLDTGKVDGKQYADPISTATVALLVNTDLLQKVGVPLPDNTDSWTWEDYDAWAKKVSAASSGAAYGVSLPSGSYQLQLWARQHGGQLYKDGKLAITPEILTAWFQEQLDLTTGGAAAPASVWSETASLPLAQSTFATGRVATLATSASLVSAYAAASKATIKLVPLPRPADAPTGWNYFKAGMYWSVSARSQHPVEAAELINFLTTDPAAVKIFGAERGLPASSTVLTEVQPTLTATDQEAVAFSQSQTSALGDAPEITPSGAATLEASLTRATQDVLFTNKTPAQAATDFISEVSGQISSAG